MDAKSVTDIFFGLFAMIPTQVPGLLPAWGKLILFGIPLCLYLAAAMMPFAVLLGLVRGNYGRRSLFERCSRQLGRLGGLLNWIFLICALLSIGYFEFAQQSVTTMHPILRLGLYAGSGCLLVGTLLWTLVMGCWKSLRNSPFLHGILIFLAGSFLAALPVIGLLTGRAYCQGVVLPEVPDFRTVAELLLPDSGITSWLALVLLHSLEVAAAGALGLIWLLVRRRADDYGRDYYTFAARWCGDWAAWGGWSSLVFLAGMICATLSSVYELMIRPEGVFFLLLLVCLLVASVLWTVIARSSLPMRHKIGMVMAGCLLIISAASGGLLLF